MDSRPDFRKDAGSSKCGVQVLTHCIAGANLSGSRTARGAHCLPGCSEWIRNSCTGLDGLRFDRALTDLQRSSFDRDSLTSVQTAQPAI